MAVLLADVLRADEGRETPHVALEDGFVHREVRGAPAPAGRRRGRLLIAGPQHPAARLAGPVLAAHRAQLLAGHGRPAGSRWQPFGTAPSSSGPARSRHRPSGPAPPRRGPALNGPVPPPSWPALLINNFLLTTSNSGLHLVLPPCIRNNTGILDGICLQTSLMHTSASLWVSFCRQWGLISVSPQCVYESLQRQLQMQTPPPPPHLVSGTKSVWSLAWSLLQKKEGAIS